MGRTEDVWEDFQPLLDHMGRAGFEAPRVFQDEWIKLDKQFRPREWPEFELHLAELSKIGVRNQACYDGNWRPLDEGHNYASPHLIYDAQAKWPLDRSPTVTGLLRDLSMEEAHEIRRPLLQAVSDRKSQEIAMQGIVATAERHNGTLSAAFNALAAPFGDAHLLEGYAGRGKPPIFRGVLIDIADGRQLFCFIEPGRRALDLGRLPLGLMVISEDRICGWGDGHRILPGIEQYLNFSSREEGVLGIVAYLKFAEGLACELRRLHATVSPLGHT